MTKDMSEEKDEYVHCPRCVDWKSKCKSLESRLKEAELHLKNMNRLHEETCKCYGDLEQRLSQAEAENEKLKALNTTHRMLYEARLEKYSHLMDVAGKMAEALEGIKNCGHEVADRLQCLEDSEDVLDFISWENVAKLALAEWDGIKESGK